MEALLRQLRNAPASGDGEPTSHDETQSLPAGETTQFPSKSSSLPFSNRTPEFQLGTGWPSWRLHFPASHAARCAM